VILVAITGWGQEEDKRRATEAGFDLHLTKPVDPTALERLLSGLKKA
jgi:CheY-like chemotaxis protein